MELLEENIINIASTVESLTMVEKIIEELCEDLNINNDFFGNILIAVTEAVNNAIQHGNQKDASKNIQIQYKAEKNKLLFFITDDGNGFDYNSLPNPTLPENIEKTSGRGIFLMQHLADSVIFHENGKKVELCFNVG